MSARSLGRRCLGPLPDAPLASSVAAPQRRLVFGPGEFRDGQLYRFYALYSTDGGRTWSGQSEDGYPFQTPG